jgi:hypothetical protein
MPLIQKRQINNVEVEYPNIISKKQKGMLPESIRFNQPYPAIAILSKRGSGKTTAIYHIIKNFLHEHCGPNKEGFVFIFSSTIEKDPLYIDLLKKIPKRVKIEEQPTKPFFGCRTVENQSSKTKIEMVDPPYIKGFDDLENFQKVTELIQSLSSPDRTFLMVIDDFSQDIKQGKNSKLIAKFCKTSRHHKTSLVLSSQYLNDLPRNLRSNIDVYLIFGSFPWDKIKAIHAEMDIPLDFDTFLKMYSDATNEKYSFFMIDVRASEFRQNFSIKYEL